MTKRQGKSGTIDVKALLAGDEEFLRALVRTALEEVLEVEMTEALGAEKSERTTGRLGYRSGYYGRTLVTRIGKLELRVPQDRGGRFSTELFERYQTLGAGAGCGAGGDVRAGGFDSQSQDDHRGVVRPQLFGLVDQRDQPAAGCEPGAICRPWLGRSVPLSDPRRALRAGARGRGDLEPSSAHRDWHRLGWPPSGAGGRARQPESRSSWRDFLLALKARGLNGVEFVVADDHAGLRAALREVLAEAAYQRCYVHFLRNALDYVPRRVDDDCLQELRWLYDRRNLAEARRDLAAWLAKWSSKYAKLTGWVEDNIDETLSFYRLPRQHHKHLKSNNMLERLNEELKRRTHVVRIFPNAESCLRLVRALAVETHENWLEQHRYLNMDDLHEHKKQALRRAA